MKKCLSITLLSFIILVGFSTNCFAATSNVISKDNCNVTTITDTKTLAEIEKTLEKPHPDAKLVGVKTLELKDVTEDVTPTYLRPGLYKTLTKIRNVKTSYYNGKRVLGHNSLKAKNMNSKLTLNISRSVSATLSTTLNFSNKESIVSGAVGFSVTRSYTVSDGFMGDVPKGRTGYVKAYPKYMRKKFDIYQKFIPRRSPEMDRGWSKEGRGHADKPIGVHFYSWLK